jgi:eukaryotic-like serine/threonine-protein kinase
MRGQRATANRPAGTLARGIGAGRRPFVGRGHELDLLRATLDEAAAGRGGMLLVTGEAGVGKTRLMQELGAWASQRDWRVLVGRCWEEGGAPAYWPWIQIVREAGGDFGRLPGPASTGLETASVDPESLRFALFDAATRFLLDAARRRGPLLLVLDDLHAADASSLLLLRFLGEAIAEARVLVVGSYREGERRVGELGDSLAQLVRIARRISLRGLSVGEVEAYLVGVVSAETPRAVSARLHAITGGNPFFLGEVVELLAKGGPLAEGAGRGLRLPIPEEVRAVIRRRVAQLSDEAMSVLVMAAVSGRAFDLRVVERLGDIPARDLLEMFAEGVAAGVLVDDPAIPGRFTFAHELVRETLYLDLPAGRRLEIHLRVGRALEELHAGEPDPPWEEIAHHLALAAPLGDASEAVACLVRAGDRASGLLAYDEAAAHYERALGLLTTATNAPGDRRCELLLRLGESRWRAGDTRRARASFEEAIDLARTLRAAELFARAAVGYVIALGGFLLVARFEAGAVGIGLLEEALAALPRRDSPLRSHVLARLAVEMWGSHEIERRVALSREAIAMARRLGDSEALVTALHCSHWALCAPDMVDDRLANTREMLAVAAETRNQEIAFLAHNARFHCFLELGDAQGIGVEIEAMAQLAERMRQPTYRWHTECLRVIRATLDGRFDDAERLADTALGQSTLWFSEYADYVYRFGQIFTIRWAQGRVGEVRETVRTHGERFPWVPRWRETLTAVEVGDAGAARAELESRARHDFADVARDGLWILNLCSLAEACVMLVDSRRAAHLYELLLPYADRNAVSVLQQSYGPVALRLGMLATMLGRWDEAERHFATALDRSCVLGARAMSARVLYEHAKMLVARGGGDDEPRARRLLDDAAALCGELGMVGVLERVSALRRRAAPARVGDAALRREGELWTIAYAGETFRLRDVKGLRYLALLLAAPGTEIHALDLLHAGEGTAPRRATAADAAAAGLSASTLGPGEPVLDAPAKEAYRRRLRDLGEDLEKARDWADPERIVRLELEIDALTDELARAAGLGGRDRELSTPAERARVSVTKAIRTTIRTIDRHCPALGAHLSASIHTGRFCSYAPPAEAPPSWSL